MTCSDIASTIGERLLFLGADTGTWLLSQFQEAAQFARAHGVDSLLVKAGDGANLWYGGLAGFRAIRSAIQGQGVGVVPYMYCYGDKYGAIDTEISNLLIYKEAFGVVCADLEVQWDGQAAWGAQMAQRISGTPGIFLVSTWADPSLQSWGSVIQALNPCVSAYMPQQYDDDLATFWGQFGQFGAKCLIPTVDLSQEFGVNHPVAVAQAARSQGHVAISAWYYGFAVANPSLFDQVLATYPKSTSTTTQEESMPIVQLGQGIGSYFKDITNGSATTRWHCEEKNVDLIGANLDFWRSCNGILGLPLTNEIYDLLGAAIVVFERGVQINDPDHKYDSPPGSGPTYLMHIDKNEGQALIAKPLIGALNTQIADLTAKVAQLEAESKPSANLQAVIAALQTVVAQLGTATTATQAALSALKSPVATKS